MFLQKMALIRLEGKKSVYISKLYLMQENKSS